MNSKKLKRVLSAILCLFLIGGLFPRITRVYALSPTYSVSSSYSGSTYYSNLCNVSLTGDQRTDIINVALSQLGYREGSSSGQNDGADRGSYNNYCEYNYWYHNNVSSGMPVGGSSAPWCATFVSWCARQAGISTSIIKNSASAGPRAGLFNLHYYAGGSQGSAYPGTTDSLFMGKNYTPKPGDIFFTSSLSHVGIVRSVSGSTFTTIEGNTNNNGSSQGNGVYSLTRSIASFYFGVPSYSSQPPASPESPQNVRTEKRLYSCEEYITIEWDASAGATDYWVYMWKDGVQLYATDVGNSLSFVSAPTSAGNYTFIVRAGNSAGYSDGPAEVSFIVYSTAPDAPTNIRATNGRCLFYCNESIPLVWDKSELATDYWVYMWKDGVELYSTDMNNNLTFTSAPTSVGNYTFIVRAGNLIGYSDGGIPFDFTVSHEPVYAVSSAPTTTASGVLTGTCSRCSGTTTVTLPKLNTTDYTYTVTKAATCTATGTGRYTWKTTTYGSIYFDVTIAKTAHTYKDTVTAPTCTAQGYTTHTCTGCGDSYKDTYTAALGHSYTYKVTTTPTTSATGKLTGTCSRCTSTTTVTLPKLNTTDYTYAVTKAATCTATGTGRYTWKTTTYGSFYFDVTIAKTAHTYKDTVTAPTCTAQGYTTHTCSGCGDSYKDTYTAALGHSYTYKVTTTPTTSATGKLTGTCSRCTSTTTVAMPKLNTTDYTYAVTKAASCTATGTGRYTWKTTTYGSFYFDVTIAKTAHSYKTTVTAPTCTAQGYTTHTCSGCGDSYKDTYTNALGHSYTYKVTTVPTTSASGVLTGTCSRCTSTTTVTLPKLNTTDYTYAVTKAATCTATGTGRYTWKTTTYGSFYFDVTIAKTAHSYKTTVTAPTCTEQGYTTHTCSVCGDSYKDTYTAALDHSYTYKVTTVPTTSVAGVLTGTCSRCTSTTTVTLPKLNTTDYTYAVTKAATCTATGTGRYTWKTTTYGTFYFDVTIAKTAHNYKDTVTAPTCTEQGYTTHTCSVCGDSYKDTYTDALGHDWDDGVVTTKPTETTEGVKTFTCTRCGATKTEPVPIIDHTHTYTSTVTAPTCTAQGYTTYTCSCGDSYVADYVAALGHDWDDGIVTTKPTETTEGVKTFTCVRCGATRTESVPALGHTHSYTATVTPPTCTEKGYTTYTCACGDSYITDYVGALGHNFVNGVCTRCGEKDPDYDPSGDPCEGYTDINGDSWYHSAADFVIARGIMGSTRTDALTFEPGAACTRGMIVSILYRLSGKPEVNFEATFQDVKEGQWFADAVIWANQNGIVKGFGNGKFGPNDKITREQMAVILKGYATYKGIDTDKIADLSDFSDVNKVTWSKPAVRWAVAEGLISGKTQNGKLYLDPQGNATRAEVAAILMRFIRNILEA